MCDASGLSTHDIVIREVVMDSQSVKVSSRSRLCQNQKFVFMTTEKNQSQYLLRTQLLERLLQDLEVSKSPK